MSQRIPKLCRHRGTGRAYVTDPATGKEVYLGVYGTPEADAAYREWVRGYLSHFSTGECRLPPGRSPTVDQLLEAYLNFAERYYRKHGEPTTEYGTLCQVLKHVSRLYGATSAEAFGPSQLKHVRQLLIDMGQARGHINKQIQRVRRTWKWAVEHELVPASTLHALQAVAGLAKGRSSAPEEEAVGPVSLDLVAKTLVALDAQQPIVAALVRVQLAAGMRPGEAVIMTPGDLDRSVLPWVYVPDRHKGEHVGRDRHIWLGPAARAVLEPLTAVLKPTDWVFPTGRQWQGRRGRYQTASYRVAIQRICRTEGLEVWTPLQLRHTAATVIRSKYGLEAAQVVMGHAEADVTQVYAERDFELARRVAEDMG